MKVSPLAGKPAPASLLVDLGRLEREYYDRRRDLEDLWSSVAGDLPERWSHRGWIVAARSAAAARLCAPTRLTVSAPL
jgi:hypothetical protein